MPRLLGAAGAPAAGGIITMAPPPAPVSTNPVNIIDVHAGTDGTDDWPSPVYEINATPAMSASVTMNNYQVWRLWNTTYTSANTTGYLLDKYGDPWPFTGTAGSTTNYTVTNYVWGAWNEEHEDLRELRAVTDVNTLQRYTRRKMSATELRKALAAEKRMREAAEAAAKKAEEAKLRAEALLRLCLSAQQREDLDKKNCFYILVEGNDGKKERYRIDRGTHGNVKQVDAKGSIIRSFCIQPPGVPEGDVMLAQKLFLEASEETRAEFWATANITTLMQEKAVPHTVPRRERRRYAAAHGLLH